MRSQSHVLRSERLSLTPLQAPDVDLVIEMFTDPEVLRFAGGAMQEHEIRREMPNWTKRGGDGCNRVVRMAIEDSPLTEIVATFEVGNVASQHVLEKVGFVDYGMMRCYGEHGPNYRITRDEWRNQREIE